MKPTILFVLATTICLANAYAQSTGLTPGITIEKKLAKGDHHQYDITLKKGEYVGMTVMQKDVDLAVDLTDPSGKQLKTFDSPNGANGPEPVSVLATQNGNYKFVIYPMLNEQGMLDSEKIAWAEENQGDYEIRDIKKLSANEYLQKLALEKKDKADFTNWLITKSVAIKTVDAGNGFEDLQPLKTVLQNVQVIGLGEASHGTSEFFRMKHRMLEFLVKEMGCTSFYIEASMTRCRYINDYVLYGKGNADTATAIQGFVTWRVEEMRNMIEWMRQYNASVPEDKKVKFYGFDLQINDNGWKELKQYYQAVNPDSAKALDSLQILTDSGMYAMNHSLMGQSATDGTSLLQWAYVHCVDVMDDMVLNEGQYRLAGGQDAYEENMMNIKLIVQELKAYKDGLNGLRDYYMAQNIMYLLSKEKPGAKVMVWAHNGHIAKDNATMGGYLAKALQDKYYAIGFEFYAGSFQTRNMDANNPTHDWNVMTVSAPPVESLPWYMNQTGKDKFFIDFRNTDTDKVKNFSQRYEVHSFGSMYSSKWPVTYASPLNIFDGMIYIKQSTAARNFTKVYL